MPFPRGSVDKPLQYALCADVLAQTARNLGYEVNPETQASWHDTMWNLVEVDHMAEAAAGETADPLRVLGALGVETTNPQPELVEAGRSLWDTMLASPKATTIDEHYQSRGAESRAVTDVFRYQSPVELQRKDRLWRQLTAISVLGVFTDSLVDAREDADTLPFSEKDLVFGAARYALATMREITPRTWMATLRAAHEVGLNYSIVRKLAHFGATGLPRLLLPRTHRVKSEPQAPNLVFARGHNGV